MFLFLGTNPLGDKERLISFWNGALDLQHKNENENRPKTTRSHTDP